MRKSFFSFGRVAIICITAWVLVAAFDVHAAETTDAEFCIVLNDPGNKKKSNACLGEDEEFYVKEKRFIALFGRLNPKDADSELKKRIKMIKDEYSVNSASIILKEVHVKNGKRPGYCLIFKEDPVIEEDAWGNPFAIECVFKISKNAFTHIFTSKGATFHDDKAIRSSARKEATKKGVDVDDMDFSISWQGSLEEDLKKDFPLISQALQKTKKAEPKLLEEAIKTFKKIVNQLKVKK